MKSKIFVPEIECESCVKVISKRLNSSGITNISAFSEGVIVEHDDSISAANIIKTIIAAGFRASLHPLDKLSFSERFSEFFSNKSKYFLEWRALFLSFSVFILLSLLEFLFLPEWNKLFWWLIYLNVSIASIGGVLWHRYAYRTKISCMVGMMIGMTFGMQSGLMFGSVFGATNGFFVGAMVGMFAGVLVGAMAGSCCGIMGVMEGMMAGLMGGTMGPMISMMMFVDNILVFMPFFMAINVAIMIGLSYLLFEEVVEHKDVVRMPLNGFVFAFYCVLTTFVLLSVMTLAPMAAWW